MEERKRSNTFVALVAAFAAILAALVSSGITSYFSLKATRELVGNNLQVAKLTNEATIYAIEKSNQTNLSIAKFNYESSIKSFEEKYKKNVNGKQINLEKRKGVLRLLRLPKQEKLFLDY